MRLFQKERAEAEKLFRSFTLDLRRKEFDSEIFDKRQIKKHLGRGLYETWRKSLEVLRYRKITIIFKEKESRISWPSNNYPDRLIVNMARAPDKELLLKTEKELLELLEIEEEIS